MTKTNEFRTMLKLSWSSVLETHSKFDGDTIRAERNQHSLNAHHNVRLIQPTTYLLNVDRIISSNEKTRTKNCQMYFHIIFFHFSLNAFLTSNYKFGSMNRRWTWFCLRPRLHIGHFFRVLMTPWMHGPQNKWPHIVDRIWSMVNMSKQIGHLVVPSVDFCGDLLLWHAFFAGDGSQSALSDAVVFLGLPSKLSHKSMVASVRYGCRTSVMKITSSSCFGPIGLIVSNCAGPPTITTLSSRLEFDELGRLDDADDESTIAMSFNTTTASRPCSSSTFGETATAAALVSGDGSLTLASEFALAAAAAASCCSRSCCVSRQYSLSDAISMSAFRIISLIDVSSVVVVGESIAARNYNM